MAKYRGVEKKAVLDSLKRAAFYLNSLDVGPEMRQALKDWLDKKPFEKISNARTDAALVRAMRETGSSHIFECFSEVFKYHALVSLETGANKEALDVYRDLSAWGGVQGALPLRDRVSGEAGAYLASQYGRDLQNLGTDPDSDAAKRLHDFAQALRKENPAAAQNLETSVQALLWMQQTSDDQSLRQYFLNQPAEEQALQHRALAAMSGLPEHESALAVDPPIKRYGIPLLDPKECDQQTNEAVDQLYEAIRDFLVLYDDKDELQATLRYGEISDDHAEKGIVFETTRRAAEDIADILATLDVIDSKGQKVMPPDQPGQRHKKGGPSPAP